MTIQTIFRNRAKRRATAWLIAAGLVALLGAGCARHAPKLYDRIKTEGGQPEQFKRYELHPQRDFIHHWTRKAYLEPQPWKFEKSGVTPDQRLIVEEWGVPDAIRKPFKSIDGNHVEEWLYYDQQTVYQFIGGEVVYEGPMTDFEWVLVNRGYPDRAETLRENAGRVLSVLVYSRVFTPHLEEFKFVNGELIQAQTGS
jgi:hypothetical protein